MSSDELRREPVRQRLSLRVGDDPDPRFTLANERTFLAWVRTSLGFIAAGVALRALGDGWFPDPWGVVAAAAMTGLGAVVAVQAFLRWWRVERAMRRKEPLPLARTASAVVVLVLLGTAIGLGVAAAV